VYWILRWRILVVFSSMGFHLKNLCLLMMWCSLCWLMVYRYTTYMMIHYYNEWHNVFHSMVYGYMHVWLRKYCQIVKLTLHWFNPPPPKCDFSANKWNHSKSYSGIVNNWKMGKININLDVSYVMLIKFDLEEIKREWNLDKVSLWI